jgi:FMN-dependent NADH-azoreductase
MKSYFIKPTKLYRGKDVFMALEIFESLADIEQSRVKGIVSSIKEHLSVDGEVDLDLLMATLEQLNEVKRETREIIKEKEKERASKEKLRKAALAKEYVQSLKAGDLITFIYGPASFQKQATLPIDKIGAATVQVTYTPDMIVGKSVTNKRNIHYDKIIVPQEFVLGKTA